MIEQSGDEKRGAAFCPNGNGVIKKKGGKIGTDVGRRNERTACWRISDSEMYDTDLTGIDNYISSPAAVPV